MNWKRVVSEQATLIEKLRAEIVELKERIPSGEKTTDAVISYLFPGNFINSLPESVSQIRVVPSRLDVAMFFPSGEKATNITISVCPTNICSSSPVSASHVIGEIAV